MTEKNKTEQENTAERTIDYVRDNATTTYTIIETEKGTSGIVHTVRNNDQLFALKVWKEIESKEESKVKKSQEDFLNDAGQSAGLEHFVNVSSIGSVDNKPAYLMPYWGRNVRRIYDHFPGVDSEIKPEQRYPINNNVVQAFRDKVVLTAIRALQKAQENSKKINHCDLIPQNILCGFNPDVLEGGKSLEEEILSGEVRLCDPTIMEGGIPGKSRFLDSIEEKERQFRDYFYPHEAGLTPLDKDTHAILALYTWLHCGHTGFDVRDFVKESLGLEIQRNKNEKKMVYPRLNEIKAAIEKKITGEGFFIIDNIVKYLVILRPLDVLIRTWQTVDLSKEEDLSKFHKNDQEHSYQALMARNEKRKDDTETKAMKAFYVRKLVETAVNSDKTIEQKLQGVEEIRGDRGKKDTLLYLEHEIQEKEKKIGSLETQENDKRMLRQEKHQQWLKNRSSSRLLNERDKVQEEIDCLVKEKRGYEGELTDFYGKKNKAEQKQQELKDEHVSAQQALIYIRDNCLSQLEESDQKEKIKEVLLKRNMISKEPKAE